MVEFYRKDLEDEKELKELLTKLNNPSYNAIRSSITNINKLSNLASAIYDSNYLGAFSLLDKEFFIKNFNAFFILLSNVGTVESYIGFFKSIYGEQSIVNIDFSVIGVAKIEVITNLLETKLVTDLDEFITTSDNKNIIAFSPFSELTKEKVYRALELLIPYGIVLDLTITNIN